MTKYTNKSLYARLLAEYKKDYDCEDYRYNTSAINRVLKKALSDMTDIVINKDKEIDRMRKRAETDFAGSPTYLQMCEKIKRLNAEVTLAEKRIVVLQQRCSEYSQRSAAPDLKHNERGAGRKKALSEDQIAEFEELLLQGAGEKQLRERFGISRSSYFLYKKRLAEKQ